MSTDDDDPFGDKQRYRTVFMKDRNGKPHKEVEVDYEGQKIKVDEELLPLLTKLWAKNYKTAFSCQNTGRDCHTYIEFPKYEHAKAYFEVLHKHLPLVVWYSPKEGYDGFAVRFEYKYLAQATALEFPQVE